MYSKIGKSRQKIIKNKINFLRNLELKGIDSSLSSFAYTPAFATKGYLSILNLEKKK